MNRIVIIACMLFLTSGCKDPDNGTIVPDPPKEVPEAVFAKGADISWVTQMEADGQKFHDASGNETECTELMKKLGMNSIRLRVWVNPEDGWCGAEDVLAKAKRAWKLGMRIMVDFHYSDTWADPGNQKTPVSWAGYDMSELAEAVGNHTVEVLGLLKDEGIDVEWVQIGNEVNNGMLHPVGKVKDKDAEAFVRLVNAGHHAAEKVYPDAKILIHVSNGHDLGLFSWFFDLMKENGAEYDMIGMSLYPTWWEGGKWRDWREDMNACLSNIPVLAEKYGKPVMICETGMPVSEPQMAKEAMQHLLTEARKLDDCHGVFYWEPQTDGVWKPSNYNEAGWSAYGMGAFAEGAATAALDPFKD